MTTRETVFVDTPANLATSCRVACTELFAFRWGLAFGGFMIILECNSIDKQVKRMWNLDTDVDVIVTVNDNTYSIQSFGSIVNRLSFGIFAF